MNCGPAMASKRGRCCHETYVNEKRIQAEDEICIHRLIFTTVNTHYVRLEWHFSHWLKGLRPNPAVYFISWRVTLWGFRICVYRKTNLPVHPYVFLFAQCTLVAQIKKQTHQQIGLRCSVMLHAFVGWFTSCCVFCAIKTNSIESAKTQIDSDKMEQSWETKQSQWNSWKK